MIPFQQSGMALSGVIPGVTPDWMTSEHMTGVTIFCGNDFFTFYVQIDIYHGRGV